MSETLTDAKRRAIVARIKRAAQLARTLTNNPVDNVNSNGIVTNLNPEN